MKTNDKHNIIKFPPRSSNKKIVKWLEECEGVEGMITIVLFDNDDIEIRVSDEIPTLEIIGLLEVIKDKILSLMDESLFIDNL